MSFLHLAHTYTHTHAHALQQIHQNTYNRNFVVNQNWHLEWEDVPSRPEAGTEIYNAALMELLQSKLVRLDDTHAPEAPARVIFTQLEFENIGAESRKRKIRLDLYHDSFIQTGTKDHPRYFMLAKSTTSWPNSDGHDPITHKSYPKREDTPLEIFCFHDMASTLSKAEVVGLRLYTGTWVNFTSNEKCSLISNEASEIKILHRSCLPENKSVTTIDVKKGGKIG